MKFRLGSFFTTRRFMRWSVPLLMILSATAISTPTVHASLASSDWPMFHHDLAHTGASPYVGAQTNTLRWKYNTITHPNIVSTFGLFSSPAIGPDGIIYVGTAENNLTAISRYGTLKWMYVVGGAINPIYTSPAIGSDGTVYFGDYDSNVYAISPPSSGTTGTVKWKFATGRVINSSPSIGPDGTLYIGSSDRNLYAINPNGTLKWNYTTGYHVVSSPAIGSDGTVYVGSEDDNIYALNPDGTLKWKTAAGGSVTDPAIGSDGTVYVGGGASLSAISPISNGTLGILRWKYSTGGLVGSPAIGPDGTVYVGSFDDNLYAISPDGTLEWKYTTGSYVYSSPAIGADGTVYVGDYDHNLYAISPPSSGTLGTLKWKYTTGGAISSSPSIGSDGTVYAGSDDGYLYAFNGHSISSSITTALFTSTGGAIHVGGSVPSEISVYDTATVIGVGGGPIPTGTVTYTFYTNATCSSSGTTQTVILSGGIVPNSTLQGPLSSGGYSFQTAYNGDGNYLPSTSTCESFTVINGSVGGASVPVDKLTLLGPFIGLASIILLIVVVATVLVRRRGVGQTTS